MRMTDLFGLTRPRLPLFAPADGAGDPAPAGDPPAPAAGAGAGAGDPPPAGDPPAPAAKWWDAKDYSDEERAWIAARGLAEDDPTKIIPKLVKGHRSAEQRIGKGLDQIMEKPGKDTPLPKWLADNRAALGLPDKEDAYAAAQPKDWPKDMAWDADLEATARKIAFDNAIPPEVHQAYVAAFAEKMRAIDQTSAEGLAQAKAAMMTDLQKDFGPQTPAVIANARRAAEWAAGQAGIGTEELERVSAVLAKDTGDAGVIRLFAAIGKAMGEDAAVGMGQGGGLTMTPAEARAELARFESPEGDYGKAYASGDATKLAELRARRNQLSKIAAGG